MSNWRLVAGVAERVSTSLPSLRFSTLFSSRSFRNVMIWPSFTEALSPALVTTSLSNMSSFSSMNSAFITA